MFWLTETICNAVASLFYYICIVKIFAVILSIYFLALNIIPCNDSGHSKDDTRVVSVIDYDGENGQDCELCSPFCQCHCCHSHTVVFNLVGFEPLDVLVSQENYVHLDGSYYSYLGSRFQPPQV
ncbi:MAG: DUF6660 family protein [Saonia sp.]